MRLFKYELFKIATKKLFWGMLVAALSVNVLALWFLNRPSISQLPHSEVKEVYDTLRVKPLSQKLTWLQNEIDLMDAYFIKDNLYSLRNMYREMSSGGSSGGRGGGGRIFGEGVRVVALKDDSDGDSEDSYSPDDWYNNWLREEITRLEEEYNTARERFGERLDEDLPWHVINARKSLYNYIINDLTVNTYSAYLDRIDEEAAILLGSAIFGADPDSFSARNIKATQDNFKDMRDTEIRYDVNGGITILFDSPSADIIILLLIIAICIALITDEKDKRLFLIVKSTPKGHVHTIIAKLGALAVGVTFVSALVFLSSIIYAEYTYGLGDVMRSVQSVPMFVGCTVQTSVAGFMGLHFLSKTIALICIGAAVMLIAIHARHSIILMLSAVILAAVNVLLSAVPVISSLNILRFLNLYSLIRPHKIFGDYFNLNIFGHPVRLAFVFIIFAVVALAVLTVGICRSYLKKHALESDLEFFKFKKLRPLPARVHTGYKFYEFKKLAFTNKALLVIIAFMLIQGYNVYNMREPYLGYQHQYIKSTLLAMQGPMTQEKHDFIGSEKQKLDHAQYELQRLDMEQMRGEISWYEYFELRRPYDEIVSSMYGFEEIYERYLFVRDTKNAQFVYDTGYARLFGMSNPNVGLTGGMWLIAIMVLCLCGVFPMEYKTGMYKILNASPNGHADTVRLKLLLSAGTMAVAFIIAVLPDLIFTGRYFGLKGLGVSVASIPAAEFGAVPTLLGSMPIWLYLAFILLLRLIMFAGITLIILALSLKIRNNAYTILVSAGILLLPLFMFRFGINLMNPFSVLELITTNGLVVAPSFFKATQVLVFAVVSTVSGWYVVRRFGKT